MTKDESMWTSKELWEKVKEENKDKRPTPIYPPIYYEIEETLNE